MLVAYRKPWHCMDLHMKTVWPPFCTDGNPICIIFRFHQVQTFRIAPLLPQIALGGGITPQMVQLPWAQLTDLTVEHITQSDCRRVHRDTPRLTECTFTEMLNEPTTDTVTTTHPALEKLT
ncbi:hypothetical protein B0H19DRAFT_1156005 [Mycena capillaripes]|nr:hypothetical protein B0H19DRAFT_1156005 [Mycena capillaripes]